MGLVCSRITDTVIMETGKEGRNVILHPTDGSSITKPMNLEHLSHAHKGKSTWVLWKITF
jgi:hypothetical protein